METELRILTAALLLAITGCASSGAQEPPAIMAAGAEPLTTPIISRQGQEIGNLKLSASPHGALLLIHLEPGALSPGWHGVHFHETGTCADTASFEMSGSHVQASESQHGLLHPHGPESGDLPNIHVAQDGSASVEIFTTLTSLSELQDENGSALILHEGPDDHFTQPIGGAGDRVACASITS
jgi:Cu-Zn family superoxide dismutase